MHDDVIESTGQLKIPLVLWCFILKDAIMLNLKNKWNFGVSKINVYKAFYPATHQWHRVVFLFGAAENKKIPNLKLLL